MFASSSRVSLVLVYLCPSRFCTLVLGWKKNPQNLSINQSKRTKVKQPSQRIQMKQFTAIVAVVVSSVVSVTEAFAPHAVPVRWRQAVATRQHQIVEMTPRSQARRRRASCPPTFFSVIGLHGQKEDDELRQAEEDAAAPLRLLRDDVNARLCASPRIRVVREEPARARPPDPSRPLSNFGLTLFRPPLPSETQQNARKQHNLGFKHLANVRNYYSQFQAQVDARDAPPVEASPAVAYQMQVSRVLQQQQQQMPPPQMPPPGYGGYPPPTGMAPVGAPRGMAPIGMQPMGAPMGMQPMGMAPMGPGQPPGPPPR